MKMLFTTLPWITWKDIGWSGTRLYFQVSFKTVAKTCSMGFSVCYELWPSSLIGPGSPPILPGHIHYLFTPAGRAYNVFISSIFSFSCNTVILATLGGGLSCLTRGGLSHGQARDQGGGALGREGVQWKPQSNVKSGFYRSGGNTFFFLIFFTKFISFSEKCCIFKLPSRLTLL